MRKGDYCISHIENMRDNECITEKRYQELKDWGVFREEHSEISELSEAACTPLMRETDPEIEAKAIEAVAKNISNGNIPTAKQVKTILENKRAGVAPGGRIQNGRSSLPNQPALSMKDFLSTEQKEEVENIEDPKIDVEQDYYTGDTPETPDEQERTNETRKLDITVPTEVSDIEDKMKDVQVAQATKDLQKEKEDERERNDIADKNENTKNRDVLVSALIDAMQSALHEGIARKEVFDALHIAIDSVFEPIKNSKLASEGLYK